MEVEAPSLPKRQWNGPQPRASLEQLLFYCGRSTLGGRVEQVLDASSSQNVALSRTLCTRHTAVGWK